MIRTLFAGWVLAIGTWGQSVEVLGPPRWIPVAPTPQERTLPPLLDRLRALPLLNPPPGVYPSAILSLLPPERPGQAPAASLLLGFWPPNDVRLTNGKLRSAGELLHLIIYSNRVREEAFDRTYWTDDRGAFYPQPPQVGELQGFPIYQGYGGSEVSGILVILPPGRPLFTPISQERFHRFTIARLEKQMASAAPALKQARDTYAAAISAEGRTAREARLAASLAGYQKGRARTPDQVRNREADLRRMDAEEEQRLKLEAAPETNRLLGPLGVALGKAQQGFAALTASEKAQPACHQPYARDSGVPQPVAAGTPGCLPVVGVGATRLLSIERYWTSRQAVARGLDRSPRNLPYHLNKEVVEALDWKSVAAGLAP